MRLKYTHDQLLSHISPGNFGLSSELGVDRRYNLDLHEKGQKS